VGSSHWVFRSLVQLTAELGLASPVLQPIRTPWLSFFYQLPIFLHDPVLQRLYLPLLTAGWHSSETFKFLKFPVNVGV
jgi:hypothetical protein